MAEFFKKKKKKIEKQNFRYFMSRYEFSLKYDCISFCRLNILSRVQKSREIKYIVFEKSYQQIDGWTVNKRFRGPLRYVWHNFPGSFIPLLYKSFFCFLLCHPFLKETILMQQRNLFIKCWTLMRWWNCISTTIIIRAA